MKESHGEESEILFRGGMGNLSQLAIAPFRGRTVVNLFGEWSNLDRVTSDPNRSRLEQGFKSGIFGGGLGRDRLFGKNVLCGLGINGATIDIQPFDSRYDGKVSSISGNAHIGIFGELWFADLALGVGRNSSENVERGDWGEFRNKYSGTQWNYHADFGLRIRRGYTKIEPFFGIHATSLNESSGANVFPSSQGMFSTGANVYNSCRILLGSRFSWEFQTPLATVSPMMYLTWLHELGDSELFTTNEMTPFPVAWRFGNNVMPRDRLILSAGATWALRDTVDLFFYYHSTFANDYNGHAIFGGLNKKF